MKRLICAIATFLSVNGAVAQERLPFVELNPDPYPSTYTPLSSSPTAITNANIIIGNGEMLLNADLLMENGKISAIGKDINIPENINVIDGTGKWVTPGIIDAHSALGVSPTLGIDAVQEFHEATKPNTAEVWIEHSFWAQDPGFSRASAAGVTTVALMPFTINSFAGRSVTMKVVPGRTGQEMKFPGAPYGILMTCGENPMREYGDKDGPKTRMGNIALFRQAWADARAYKNSWDQYKLDYDAGKNVIAPTQNHQLETLSGALRGDINVYVHCYRADDMAVMIDMAKEFGYQIKAFHRTMEGYKIADMLKENDICSVMWADLWGYRAEVTDGIDENIAMTARHGACVAMQSDDVQVLQRLNMEMAKAWADGKKNGIDIPKAEAFSWITLNTAKTLGIDHLTGSLEVGKMADVVLWTGDPFSVYTLTDTVFIDGAITFKRDDPNTYWQSDFELEYVEKGAHQ